ncbi:competence protein CoiA family protein [Blastococcus sp. SYSU D00669]
MTTTMPVGSQVEVPGALRWAVTDGAAGTHAVPAPDDREDARQVREHYRGAFWCSTEAGGCGGRLQLVVAGRLPRFRHVDDGPCRFADGGADAALAYEHLRYQRAVMAWLAAQGHRGRVEKVRRPDGRTDLHVVVDGLAAAVEVQLSPLPDTTWRERDDAARTRFRQVTWLYGPAAEAAATTEAAVRGVAFALRRQGAGLAVGVRDVDGRTRWVRLGACRLGADGFVAPGVEEARALHARRAEERAQVARRAAGRRRGAARESWAEPMLPLPFAG